MIHITEASPVRDTEDGCQDPTLESTPRCQVCWPLIGQYSCYSPLIGQYSSVSGYSVSSDRILQPLKHHHPQKKSDQASWRNLILRESETETDLCSQFTRSHNVDDDDDENEDDDDDDDNDDEGNALMCQDVSEKQELQEKDKQGETHINIDD